MSSSLPQGTALKSSSILAAIAIGGIVAGSVDIGVAAVINSVPVGVVLKAIASGIYGNAAFTMAGAVPVGLILQWLMSIVIAAIYLGVCRSSRFIVRHPVWSAVVAGVVNFAVMTYVVVAFSAAVPKPHFTTGTLLVNLAANVLFILILAGAQRLFPRQRV
jgi:hypothetical protein